MCGMKTSISDVEIGGFECAHSRLTTVGNGDLETRRVRQTSMVEHTIGSSSTTRTRGTLIPSSSGGGQATRTFP
jgi:hypothetical protein